jgi:outer membrane protein
VYSGARYALEAGRERLPQGRALLLPSLNLTGSATKSRLEVESKDTSVSPSFTRNPSALGYTFTLAQPIFRPQNYYQYEQS